MELPKESESKLNIIVENSSNSLIITNRDGIVLFFNEATMFQLHRNREELLGKPLNLPMVFDADTEISIFRTELGVGERGVGQMRVTEVEWEGRPAYLVVINDITELKKVDRLKSELISTVSHELRTPLSTMKEFVSILLDEMPGPLNKGQKEYLSIIRGNIDRLARLIADLLDFSKIESRKMKLTKVFINPAQLADKVICALKPIAEKKHIEFKTVFPSAALAVYADPDKMVQVLTNLIGNSIKFTNESGHITVEIKDTDKEVVCSITDTGRGIAPENLARLFQKFVQIEREDGAGARGTGLGLAISKGLVELHNGRIWVESKFGEGSTFSFALPRLMEEEIFRDAVEEKIAAAQKEETKFAMFIARFDNYSEFERKYGKDKAQETFLSMSSELEKVARRIDFFIGSQETVAFVEADKTEEMSRVVAKVKKAIKASLLGVREHFNTSLSCGCVVYPDDADNTEDFLAKGHESFAQEKAARLKKAIMIVDDEQSAREVLIKILKASGYSNFIEAGDGTEALEKIKTAKPDLLILDLKMPRMNGYEVIGVLKENEETRDIPVLLMSGYPVEVGKIREYLVKKAIPVIGKPFSVEQLEMFVNYLL